MTRAGKWEWRKRYRVWEANRKVFLYAESFVEGDLRDDKTMAQGPHASRRAG